jgi:hypothetical protein
MRIPKPNPAPRRGPGHPTHYKPEYCGQAKKLCELSATSKELAAFFDVDRKTIHNWRTTQPDFRAALEVGRRAPNRLQSVLRRLEQARNLMTPSEERASVGALRAAVANPNPRPGKPGVGGVNPTTLSHARVIVNHAPELVEKVLAGALPFMTAFAEASRRRQEQNGAPKR